MGHISKFYQCCTIWGLQQFRVTSLLHDCISAWFITKNACIAECRDIECFLSDSQEGHVPQKVGKNIKFSACIDIYTSQPFIYLFLKIQADNNVDLQIILARSRAIEIANTRARKKALEDAINVGILTSSDVKFSLWTVNC